jgi:hypothetical protein
MSTRIKDTSNTTKYTVYDTWYRNRGAFVQNAGSPTQYPPVQSYINRTFASPFDSKKEKIRITVKRWMNM